MSMGMMIDPNTGGWIPYPDSPKPSVGACTLSNSPSGLGGDMIQDRIKGLSWKEIADKYQLGSPGAARTKFQKLTGITDFKIKGQDLKNLVDNGLLDQLKVATEKKVKKAVAEVDDALKVANASIKGPEAVQEVAQQVAKEAFDWQNAAAKIQWVDLEDKYGANMVQSVVHMIDGNKGYLHIKSATNLEFSQIDEIAWNHILLKNKGDVWKAYLEKPTSQNGFNAVKQHVFDMQKQGFLNNEIAAARNIPQSVLDMITDGDWSMPPMGSKTPILHKVSKPSPSSFGGVQSGYQAPPKPPPTTTPKVHYTSDRVNTGYQYHSESEWIQWHNNSQRVTAEQMEAWKRYTGSGYRELNGYARGKITLSPSGRASADRSMKLLDDSMQPIPFDTVVTRYTGTNSFNGPIDAIGGTVQKDNAVLSTAVHKSGTFSDKSVRMEIHVPKGVRGRYVDPFSSVQGEKEFVLPANTRLMITHVEVTGTDYYGNPKYLVKATVLVTG